MDFQRFLELARSQHVTDLLRTTVGPAVRPGQRAIVYPLPFVNRIGHLAPEPHYFATIFAAEYEQLILLTPPRATEGVNTALFDLLGTRFTMVETEHELLPRLALRNDGVVSGPGFDICLALPARFYREYAIRRQAGAPLQFLELTETLRERAALWFRTLGLDPAQPFVTVHVRDQSYVPQAQYQGHGDMRSASLANFVPAIDWLADQGLAVFRLGDRNAAPLETGNPLIIDLPFRDDHERWMDVFLCGACRFSLNCQSGPEALVRAFGNRSVNTNLVPTVFGHHLDHDLFLYKPIRVGEDGAPLSYAEILAADLPINVLPFMLPDPAFYAAGDFRLRENSAEAVLAAAQEMNARIEAGTTTASSPANDCFVAMSQTYQARIAQNAEVTGKFFDQYTHAFGWGKIAEATLTDAPGFL